MSEERQVKPWDFIKPNVKIASKKVVEERLSVCSSCPSYRPIIKQCKICSCIMTAKAKLADATCPIGKWSATSDLSDNHNLN